MRPPVSVVVPFLGDEAAAREVVARLLSLSTREGDELIVADNTPSGIVRPPAGSTVRTVPVGDRLSAAHARNQGAAAAANDWLLFLDADCLPPAGLLDAYFVPAPGGRCAIVAGEIAGDPSQTAPLARWSRSRRGRWVERLAADGLRPAAVSANMLVRRTAFEQGGRFRPGGGADFDLSWRLQDAGWELESRPAALVHHRDRETLREVAEQARSYGSDLRNLRRTHGAAVVAPRPLAPLRALGAAAVWLVRREPERARFALVDGLYFANAWAGAAFGGPRRRRAD